MGDVESNGKQLQIDFLKEQLTSIHNELACINRWLNQQNVTMATYIAGRESSCPLREKIDEQFREILGAVDGKVSKGDIKLLWGALIGSLGIIATFLAIVGNLRSWW